MKLTQKNLNFLNLTSNQANILATLAGINHGKVTDLAIKTRLPRTTITFLLKQLEKRGLTKRIKVANHYEWQKISDQVFGHKLIGILNLVEGKPTIGKIISPNIQIEIFQGKNQIDQAYEKMFELSKGNRVYAIQCEKSAQYAVEQMKKQYLFDIHKKFKKNKIIMEGIIGQSILKYFNKLSLPKLKSHLGRMVIASIVPDEFIDFDADIMICNDITFIIDFSENNVIFIKNKLLTKIFTNFYQLLLQNAQKIDLNEYIKNLIKEKSEI